MIDADPRKQLLTKRIISAAFMGSLLIYGAVILFTTAGDPGRAAKPPHPVFVASLAMFGGAALVIAHVVSRRRGGGVAAEFTRFIVALAFRESCAIYGLVLAFVSLEPLWYAAFGAPALFAMLFDWPRARD